MFVKFKEWHCTLIKGTYQDGSPSLRLVDNSSYEPIAVCTVSIPKIKLPEGCVIIKDYSENEGMLDALVFAGVVSIPVGYVESDRVRIPVCKLLV